MNLYDPFPTFQTDRLDIRGFRDSDIDDYFRLRTDVEVMRYINRPMPDRNDKMEQIRRVYQMHAEGTGIGWAISLKENPALIGTIGFYRLNLANFRAEIGYMIMPEYWRKGYTNEAIQAVLHFGFTKVNLHSVEADINPDNEASRSILLKNGFQKEAYFRENFYFEGQFLDSEIYSLLVSEWKGAEK